MKIACAAIVGLLLVSCAAQAPAANEKKSLSELVAEAEAAADSQLIVDDHVYAGIELLGPVPTSAVPLPEQGDQFVRRFRLDNVAPFTFALVEVSDERIVGISLHYLAKSSIDAREFFRAVERKMYAKYNKSENIGSDRADISLWSFLTRAKWIEYRASSMERAQEMPILFGNRKRTSTGIDDVLQRAGVSLFPPDDKIPGYFVVASYESHALRQAKSERRKDLEDSLDL